MSPDPRTGSVRETWSRAKRILCVRLDTLGDVLMTSPALRALKESAEGREVCLLTSRLGAAIARLVPVIDEVIAYDAPWLKATEPRDDVEPDLNMLRRLREEKFDAAVIFTVYSQSPLPAALFCYLAGIPLRLAHCRENPYHLLTTWAPETEPDQQIRHEVRRQLDLVETVGAATRDERMVIKVSEGARIRIRRLLAETGVRVNDRWVVIHPGASAASRRYPAEKFAEVASRLAGECGVQVVFTGAPEETDLVSGIRKQAKAGSGSLAGQLSLEEMAALLEAAPLLISNNTGPAHIAAAVGTPVVDLYALTNPQHTPWGVEHRVLSHDVPCKYCYKSVCPEGHNNCLALISPGAVVAAAQELLVVRLAVPA